jgi:HSP20 family protein
MATETLPVKKGKAGTKLVNWFDEMRGDMARLWQDWPFARWSMPALPQSVAQVGQWSPRVDIYERGNRLVVKTDLPGMKREEIELSLEDGDLVLCGERHEREEVDEENYYRMERSSGTFCRRIPLYPGLKAEDVHAKFEEGVLEVEMPKPAKVGPTGERIKIR